MFLRKAGTLTKKCDTFLNIFPHVHCYCCILPDWYRLMRFCIEDVTVEPDDHTDCQDLLQIAKGHLERVAEQAGYGDGATIDYGKVLHRLGEWDLPYEVLYQCIEDGNLHTQMRAHECLGKCYEAVDDIDSAINQYNMVKTKKREPGHNFRGNFYAQRLAVLEARQNLAPQSM